VSPFFWLSSRYTFVTRSKFTASSGTQAPSTGGYFTVPYPNAYARGPVRRPMFDGALREAPGGVFVDVDVRPGAPATRITGYHEGRHALRVDVAAKPERGAANRELLTFLTGLVEGASARIVRGAGSRHKTVLVRGAPREAVLAALARGSR